MRIAPSSFPPFYGQLLVVIDVDLADFALPKIHLYFVHFAVAELVGKVPLARLAHGRVKRG